MTLERPQNTTERWVARRHIPVIGKISNRVQTLLGVDIPTSVQIGYGLDLPHGAFGVVIHENTIIGDNVVIFHGVTIGRADQYNQGPGDGAPDGVRIGNRVRIGAGAAILYTSGRVLSIGDDAVIGANAVVTNNVGPAEIWAGNPARYVRVNPAVSQVVPR